jgi:hypothetical protein
MGAQFSVLAPNIATFLLPTTPFGSTDIAALEQHPTVSHREIFDWRHMTVVSAA